MNDTRTLLVTALYGQEADRPRTQQVELGPSSLGSCSRQVVMKLMGVQAINETLKLPSIMGTAIHDTIEKALRKAGYETVEITVPGVEGLLGDGHIDFYQPLRHTVTDWKTSSKKNLRYFPSQSQRWQVQMYGYLLTEAGYEVRTVELVAIARDGTEEDIKVHGEPYDERVALEALAWLEDRQAEAVNGVLPPPEKSGVFCQKYCPFYGPDEGYCLGK